MFCTRALAHVRALMTQKSCAVGMRKEKFGNHLKRYLYSAKCSWIIKFLIGLFVIGQFNKAITFKAVV